MDLKAARNCDPPFPDDVALRKVAQASHRAVSLRDRDPTDCAILRADDRRPLMKDFAPGISDDKVGSAINLSWQEVIARDIQLMLLHHERKAANGAKRVHSLDDVYGSTWLTSGLGSVIVLEGEPGDPTVELRHLKQPAEPVGPLTLRHDHTVGVTVRFDERPDLLQYLIAAGPNGITAEEAALAIIGRASDNDRKTIRRQLARLVDQDLATKQSGERTGHGA